MRVLEGFGVKDDDDDDDDAALLLWPYENHSQLQLTVSLLAEQTQILSENRLGQQNFEFKLCNASLAAAFTFFPTFPG